MSHVPGSVLVGVRPFGWTTVANAERMIEATMLRDPHWYTLSICAQEPVRWWRANMLNPRITVAGLLANTP